MPRPRASAVTWSVVYGTLLLTSGRIAESQDGPVRSHREPPASVPAAKALESEPLDLEWVFIDGEYIPPPHVLAYDPETERASLNGHLINAELRHVEQDDDDEWSEDWHESRQISRRRGPARRLARMLNENSCVVLAWPDQPLILLPESGDGLELLALLIGEPLADTSAEAFVEKLPDSHQDRVARWLTEFRPSARLADRVREALNEYLNAEAENVRQITAIRRLEAFNYPLSVVGMVLCALGFGHLLRNHPPEEPAEPTVKARRQVHRSLLLAVAFSVLDLLWTLLALHAGNMQELNPFASGLISSPMGLAAFKVGFTTLAVGIIYASWRHHSAQVASWWACLILTLLTARWLTLNSLVV